MFEVGDEVMVAGGIQGTIMDFYYDEGNIWVVDIGMGNEIECGDDELTPAKRG
jgi:preprotein translocase subunit YajC